MDFPNHPFWDFSIQVHKQAGVHEACLALQNRYAIDINLLFFCCWFGAAGGGTLDETRMVNAMKSVKGWQEGVVRPIWKARWLLKPAYKNFPTERTEPLRRALIEAELDAEHIEQLHLVDTIGSPKEQNFSEDVKVAHAVANMFLYFNTLAKDNTKIPLQKNYATEPLVTLVSACFPGQEKGGLKSLIEDQF